MSDEHETPPPFADKAGQNDEPDMLGEDDLARDPEGQDNPALQAAQRQIAELNDKVLRLAAELENTRRRGQREKADAGRYAIANFARDLIVVADNFERAFQAAENGGEGSVTALVDGLKMTEKELLSVLERHGVRKVAAERERFDPNLHQAVAQIPHGEIPHGHVVDVAQQGFTIGDRVLRAAMVTVSSGPGKGSGETPSSGGGDGQADDPGERLDTKV